ncbi:hypothetical protein EWM64_g4207 [Hericium alpestre]|uniref:Uncharacterized protein n=1 Tax=Hericium alpestre TaxID=135208 RepID=A0A4Z0A0F3_9AGAM|nr:hypothetical protein EWM64_g4207 [Hericium alpestre]
MCGEDFYMGQIAGLWTQTLLFGFYVALFAVSIYVLRDNKTNNTYYLGTSIAMFALCATLLILNFVQILLTPDFVAGSQCVGSLCVSCNPGEVDRVNQAIIQNFFNVLLDFVFAINQLVADSLLIFRCYILWKGRTWIVIAPAIILLANTGLTFAQAYCDITLYYLRRTIPADVKVPPPRWLEISNLNGNLSVATMLLSLATNLVATGLIVGRIWWMAKKLEGTLGVSVGKRYHSAITMIVESGAIWSTSIVIWLITYFLTPNYHGIAPTLIIVRVGLGKSVESQASGVNVSPSSTYVQGLGSRRTESTDSSGSIETKQKWAEMDDADTTVDGNVDHLFTQSPKFEKVDLDRSIPDRPDRWI